MKETPDVSRGASSDVAETVSQGASNGTTEAPERKVSADVRDRVLGEIRDRNLLDEKLLRSYMCISIEGPLTGSELDDLLGVGQGPHGHISALRYFGLVEEVGRKIGKSGIGAGVHDVTDKIPEQRGTWKLYREISGKGGRAQKEKDAAKDSKVGRGIWQQIRKELHAYYSPKLIGFDTLTVDHFLQSIDIDVATINTLINHRISSILQNEGPSSRRKLIAACQLLGLRGPGAGRPLDLQLARRKMHRLAREYHPDINPSGVEMYHRIVEAFHVIESYTSNGKANGKAKGDKDA